MKTTLVLLARDSFWIRGFPRRTAILIATAAISACTADRLHAVVIDDFNDPTPKWTGANYPGAPCDPPAVMELADQQLRLAAGFTTATSPASPFDHFMNIYCTTNLPVEERRTLELRVDRVSASHDNLFAFLGTMNASGGEYFMVMDRNEIALLKWSQQDGFSLGFWTNAVIRNPEVVLVLTLTPVKLGLLIGTKVEDKVTGRSLFQRTVLDTPASDWGVPDPLPHGWQIFDPDPGPSYAEDLTLVWVGMLHDTDGQQGLAEARFDNLEYDTYASPYLEIGGGATLLTWPEDTTEHLIVAGADSLTSETWMPCPEPIYKRFGQFCMTMPVPTAGGCEFRKLVPGAQFIDDFDPAKWPYATKGDWVPHFWEASNASRYTLNNENGSVRIQCQSSTGSGQIIYMPPGPDVKVADFWVSLDILNWGGSTHSRSVGFIVRGTIQRDPFPGSSNGYLGELWFNRPGAQGMASLNIFTNADQEIGEGFDLTPGTRYRLIFFGVGRQLTLQLYELGELPTLVKERGRTASLWSSGAVGLWFANYGGLEYDFSVDNFFVTGTKP